MPIFRYTVSLLLLIILFSGCGQAMQPSSTPPTATVPQVVAFQTTTPAPPTTTPETTASSTQSSAAAPLEGQALIQALQQGGYVIFFRHAATYRSQLDTDQQNLKNCQTQRNLNQEGQAQAEAIGHAFQQANIPLGDILASPYCRTRDTAQIAFGRVELVEALINPYAKEDEAEVARLGQQLRQLLSIPPTPGTNTVLVGHIPNFQAATGLSLIEGEAAIFMPDGQGDVTLVARVLPDEWLAFVTKETDRQ